MSALNRNGYSDPVEVYISTMGEQVEKYARDAVLPPVKMVQRGRWQYRRNVQTGAWVSHDKYLGRYGCGCCHTNRCDPDCPGQEAATYGPMVEEAEAEAERRIPLAAAMKQAMGVYAGAVKPDELTPPTEREEQRA